MMNKQTIIIVTEEQATSRLDVFLVLELAVSRSVLKKLIDQGLILVNQLKVKAGYIIKEFDEISFSTNDFVVSNSHEQIEPLDVFYEVIESNENYQIISKPKNLTVHPAPGYHEPTLVHGLLFNNQHLSTVNGEYRPGIVHRLDKDTNGLLVVANNNETHRMIASQFMARTPIRKYYALVYGTFSEDSGTINAPIGRHPKNRLKQTVIESGRDAITNFTVLRRFQDFTLLSVELITGRTHQIRVHLEYINHPIVGDLMYGPKKNLHLDGQLLTSYFLAFIDPIKKTEVQFEIELPFEITNFIKNLT